MWDVSLRIKTRVITHISQTLGVMKEIVLKIQDNAFDDFLGMIRHCPFIEVVSTSQDVDSKETLDKCFHEALMEIRRDRVLRTRGDYAYIMLALSLLSDGGLRGALLHVMAHASSKGCLFLCAGVFIYKLGRRGVDEGKNPKRRKDTGSL